jgi:uncharacterized membrane protein YgaE (UPF0421/DUF939 family)
MGVRVIKTAIAATSALYIAWLFELEFYLAAGILAILSVEVTRKRNFTSAGQRLLASLVGLILAAILFELLGYHMWVLGLYIVLSFPLLAAIHLKDGIVTGAVIVFHVYEAGNVTVYSMWNEVLLLIIGIGSATIINVIYMPAHDQHLMQQRKLIEQYFSIMFQRIGEYLRDAQSDWSGGELLSAEKTIDNASHLALRNMENEWFRSDQPNWYVYFKMREEQLESIRQMLTLTAQVSHAVPQGDALAHVFFSIGDDLKEDHYTGNTERKLDELETFFKLMPLPQNRQEFETRSALLQLMLEMRRYLAIARNKK